MRPILYSMKGLKILQLLPDQMLDHGGGTPYSSAPIYTPECKGKTKEWSFLCKDTTRWDGQESDQRRWDLKRTPWALHFHTTTTQLHLNSKRMRSLVSKETMVLRLWEIFMPRTQLLSKTVAPCGEGHTVYSVFIPKFPKSALFQAELRKAEKIGNTCRILASDLAKRYGWKSSRLHMQLQRKNRHPLLFAPATFFGYIMFRKYKYRRLKCQAKFQNIPPEVGNQTWTWSNRFVAIFFYSKTAVTDRRKGLNIFCTFVWIRVTILRVAGFSLVKENCFAQLALCCAILQG